VNFLANISWKKITLIVVAWFFVWIALGAIGTFMLLHSFTGSATSGTGGIAAAGFSLTRRGVMIIFGPPILLVLLRLIAPRFRSG
jgi:hypothetical protein